MVLHNLGPFIYVHMYRKHIRIYIMISVLDKFGWLMFLFLFDISSFSSAVDIYIYTFDFLGCGCVPSVWFFCSSDFLVLLGI